MGESSRVISNRFLPLSTLYLSGESSTVLYFAGTPLPSKVAFSVTKARKGISKNVEIRGVAI